MIIIEKIPGGISADNVKSHPAIVYSGSGIYLTIDRPPHKSGYESYEYDAINLTNGEFVHHLNLESFLIYDGKITIRNSNAVYNKGS